MYRVYWGDNRRIIRILLDYGVQVDSVVTDPPYGLRFMNKHWDYDVPSVKTWRLVYDLLKPGGHVLCFGGTRTYHRLVVNIEEAGFDIRDTVMWLYGSGFPKSLDVAKAIDKAARGVPQGGSDPTSPAHGKYKGGCSEENPKGRGFGAGPGQFMKRQTLNSMENPNLKNRCLICGKPFFSGNPCRCPKAKLTTDEAKQWNGWGTALKPACELICLARKPLGKSTVAGNVLKHGTGGLNIDGCRIESTPWKAHTATGLAKVKFFTSGETPIIYKEPHMSGRWPANVILDEEAGSLLDEQSGVTSITGDRSKRSQFASVIGTNWGTDNHKSKEYPGDSGGTSRFFYCAKASRKERNDSKHPTVKPLKLIRYLCRLITPPNGLVFDPFAGTGTTGKAAELENFNSILIEKEEQYVDDIERRLSA